MWQRTLFNPVFFLTRRCLLKVASARKLRERVMHTAESVLSFERGGGGRRNGSPGAVSHRIRDRVEADRGNARI